MLHAEHEGITATRTLFPATENRIAMQEWHLENTGAETVTIEVPGMRRVLTPDQWRGGWEELAADKREWLVDVVVKPVPPKTLEPGAAVAFAVAYAAYLESNRDKPHPSIPSRTTSSWPACGCG